MPNKQTDVIVHRLGSTVQFDPQTNDAEKWFRDNIETNNWQWLSRNLCVEHRLAEALIECIRISGFTVKS